VLDHHLLDGVDAVQVVARPMRVVAEEEVPHGFELEEDLLEPELVGLVQDDEQQLVVGGGIGE
jgi:hypothetical protein